MAYLSFTYTPLLEESEIVKYLKKNTQIQALKPQNQHNSGQKSNDQKIKSNMTQSEAAKILVIFTAKILVGHLVSLFTDMTLSRLTIKTLEKNKKNTKLFDNLNQQIQGVYTKHKDYHPCSAKQFMNTSMYDYFMSEFRDKSAQDVAKIVGYKSLDNCISIAIGDLVPIPGSALLAIPVKMALTYCGVRGWGLGSLYNMAFEINGNTLSMGIDFRPAGFLLTNFILYTFNGENKLVATYLKNPPENSYQVTQTDVDNILDKYGKDKNVNILQKDIEKE